MLRSASWPTDPWWAWLAAIVFYDFCYYWNHRLGHESAVFWAAHVVHHQSRCYNLSTALRQTSSGVLSVGLLRADGHRRRTPANVRGRGDRRPAVPVLDPHRARRQARLVRPLVRLAFNHRVHHAVNDRYVDRNYGGILMVWDRCSARSSRRRSAACTARVRRSGRGIRSGPTSRCTPTSRANPARPIAGATRCGCGSCHPAGSRPRRPVVDGRNRPSTCSASPPMIRRWAGSSAPSQSGSSRSQSSARCPCSGSRTRCLSAALLGGAAAVIAVLWLTGAVMQGRVRPRTALVVEAAAALSLLGTVLAA